jgi:prophage maintenance system killer protein
MKKTQPQNNKELVIYQSKSGAIEFRGDFKKETIWATQAQIAKMFDVTPQNITLHINNIYKDGELRSKATCKDYLQVQIEGNRKIKRKVKLYNLDLIIATGYRINSVIGTQFRMWATKTLRDHITKGFTVNKKQIQKNYQEFLKTVESIQNLLPEHITLDPKAILDLVKEFSGTWMSLDAYDKESLAVVGKTKKSIALSGEELTDAIHNLRKELIKKGEASDIFAQERSAGSVEGIVGNVLQSIGHKDVYPTAEEKSAHLLYFMVKNHPFVDGNKRSGAFAFIWFLRKIGVKGYKNINPSALTALTLLIAESKPEKKDQMVALVTQMLK